MEGSGRPSRCGARRVFVLVWQGEKAGWVTHPTSRSGKQDGADQVGMDRAGRQGTWKIVMVL